MRNSERGTFNSCPFKYSLEKQGLRLNGASLMAEDRNFGIAIHAGLEAHYKGGDWASVLKAYSDAYPSQIEYKNKAKSVEGGALALRAYIEYWAEQDKLWEVVDVELSGKVKFNDSDDDEHGLRVDMVARHKQTGDVWLWDHKTTDKNLGKYFWKKYELDAQVTRYTKWANQQYGSCGGFIINGIQVGHRERAYKGEPAGYYQRFDRQIFSRSKAQIEFWEKSEKEWMTLIQFCEEIDTYPKHLGSLCSYCDYYALCMSGNNENVREALYTTEPMEETINIIDETK